MPAAAKEQEEGKPPSPKPDQDGEVAPPLVEQKKKAGADAPAKDSRRASVGPAKAQAAKGPAAKKNVLLSEDQRKEMQKQLKAEKDSRRVQCDGRHHWMFLKMADSLGLDAAQVEDFILGDEKFDTIDEFFLANGRRLLMFFYQEVHREVTTTHGRTDASSQAAPKEGHKKLFITNGAAEGLNGMCFIFLRANTDKAITPNNIAQEVTYSLLDCSGGKLLEGIEKMFAHIIVPHLQTHDDWGPLKEQNKGMISEFLDQVEQFVSSLSGARANMEGQVTLSEHELDYMLEGYKSPADFQSAGEA